MQLPSGSPALPALLALHSLSVRPTMDPGEEPGTREAAVPRLAI
jgi:hypothetical protein